MSYQEIYQTCAIISALIGSTSCGYQMNKDANEAILNNKKMDIGDYFIGCIIVVAISAVMGPLGIAFWVGDILFELRKNKGASSK